MLALVVTDGHQVRLVEEDVARHQDRVGEQAGGDELLAGRLVLELGHAPQLAVAGHGAQQPGRLGVGADVALDEDGRAVGVDPDREEHGRQVERLLAEVARVVADGDRVQVDDAEERLALLLGRRILAEAAAVVAERLFARGSDAGEDAHGSRPHSFRPAQARRPRWSSPR